MFILNGALFGIWASRIPAVATRFDLSPGVLGGLLLLMAAGAIASFPIAGRLSDKIGAAKVTRRMAFAYVGTLFLIAFAPTYLTFCVALFLFGATQAGLDVAMNVWAAEAERHIGRPMMSSFHAMFSLGAGLGAASGFVAETYGVGITPHFVIAGAGIAAITLFAARGNWISDIQDTGPAGPVFRLPKGPLFVVGFIAFCASLGEGGMADWSAIFLVHSSGATEAQAALGYTVFSIAMVVMRLLGDAITLRLGPVGAARLAGSVATVGVLCAVGFGTFGMSLVGFFLMGIGYAMIMPLALSRAANDPHTSPGTALAAVSTLGYGGLLLGPPIIGFLSEATSVRVAFTLLAVLAALIVVLSRSISKQDI
ncbi:MFS transporter [Parasedimentitalea marina]|uniref:MFS transporter n=2 Tax=Parasedimentitalea marina TaxID=2483033 RepID=A0A3T0N940_9RHOB|nr:MFS transporter [Parasedimentitalea marina]